MVKLELKSKELTFVSIAKTGKSLRGFANHIGVSHAYLSQILSGKRKPSPTIGYKIAEGLKLNIEDIFLINSVDSSTKIHLGGEKQC